MLQIPLADLKIAANPVPPLRGKVKLSVFFRVEHGIFKVSERLSFPGPLRHDFFHKVMAFSKDFPHNGLMLCQILERFCNLRILPPEISNHHVQICHMIIGKTLDLLLFDNRHILLRNLLL